MAIEFRCPRCQTSIRTPAESAGTKGFCPTCKGKVRVPQGDPTAPVPVQTAAQEATFFGFNIAMDDPAPSIASPSASSGSSSKASPVVARKASPLKSQILMAAMLLPITLIFLLTAVVIHLLRNPAQVSGTATAVAFKEDLDPVPLDNGVTDPHVDRIKRVLKCIGARPLAWKSELMSVQFGTRGSALTVQLKAGPDATRYRVGLSRAPALQTFADANRVKLDAPRMAELDEAFPRFLTALKKRCDENGEDKPLFEFRNSVGLNSLVRGLGYHTRAVVNNVAYPCVMETDNTLYFALPRGLSSFVIEGYNPEGSTATVAGKFVVDVSGTASAPENEEKEEKPKRSKKSSDDDAKPAPAEMSPDSSEMESDKDDGKEMKK